MIEYIIIYYIVTTIVFSGIITDKTNKGKFTFLDVTVIICFGWFMAPLIILYIIGRYIGYLTNKY